MKLNEQVILIGIMSVAMNAKCAFLVHSIQNNSTTLADNDADPLAITFVKKYWPALR